MKLFDFLQDCVAIAAVLSLVAFMTADSGDATDSPQLSNSQPASSQLAATSPSDTAPLGTAPSESQIVSKSLDALEAELRGLLAAPIPELSETPGNGFEQPEAFEVPEGVARIAPPATGYRDVPIQPTPQPARPLEASAPVERAVPLVPDAYGYDLSESVPGEEFDLSEMMGSRPQRQPAASGAQRRSGGEAPSASRPMRNRPIHTLPPPPMDDEESGLQPFGASLMPKSFDDLAHGARPPRRVR